MSNFDVERKMSSGIVDMSFHSTTVRVWTHLADGKLHHHSLIVHITLKLKEKPGGNSKTLGKQLSNRDHWILFRVANDLRAYQSSLRRELITFLNFCPDGDQLFQWFPLYYSYQPRCPLPSTTGRLTHRSSMGPNLQESFQVDSVRAIKRRRATNMGRMAAGKNLSECCGCLSISRFCSVWRYRWVVVSEVLEKAGHQSASWAKRTVLEQVIGDEGRRRVRLP
jgi:hypothetical protein